MAASASVKCLNFLTNPRESTSYFIYEFSLQQVISKETSQGCLKVQSIDIHAHKKKNKKQKEDETIINSTSTEVKLHIRYSAVLNGRLCSKH